MNPQQNNTEIYGGQDFDKNNNDPDIQLEQYELYGTTT